MRGLNAIALAIATRRRWPPDSSDGMRLRKSPRPTQPSTSLTRSSASGIGMPAFLVELVADVFAHGERIEQRALLEDHPEVGADAHHVALRQLVHALAVHPDHAAVGVQQPGDDLQNRRLPGAARAEDDLGVAGDQREADVLQHHFLVERQAHLIEQHHRRTRFAQDLRRRRGRCCLRHVSTSWQ